MALPLPIRVTRGLGDYQKSPYFIITKNKDNGD
jgi:hypothetical protein